MILQIIVIIIQAVVAFLVGTVIFDIIHYFLHRLMKSKNPVLRAIGTIHSAHHRFYSSSLKIDKEWADKNFRRHILFEHLVHIGGILLCLLFFYPAAIVCALILEVSIFINVCINDGVDAHHKSYEKLPAKNGGIFVDAPYHALHHVFPSRYYSSIIKVIDYLLGTGISLTNKKIVMTGANGALGASMKRLLEKEGAKVTTFKFGTDYSYTHYEQLIPALAEADILFLCHGSKFDDAQAANCDSFVRLIELYRSVHKAGLLPAEVWAVGSEIESHPCFGIKKLQVYADSKRNYAGNAYRYYHDPEIVYRHLVHSAFTSKMGPGLMTANFAARMTLFLLKRDFKYVPVTYTGIAWLNYLKFIRKPKATRIS